MARLDRWQRPQSAPRGTSLGPSTLIYLKVCFPATGQGPELARNRHGGAVAACPLSRDKRTWPGRGSTSENDPSETSARRFRYRNALLRLDAGGGSERHHGEPKLGQPRRPNLLKPPVLHRLQFTRIICWSGLAPTVGQRLHDCGDQREDVNMRVRKSQSPSGILGGLGALSKKPIGQRSCSTF
jgi:hypothetical protein